MSHEGAERLVSDWMRHLGVVDADPTRFTQDGGLDVVGTGWVAQVKNYAGSVSVKDVRELVGAATLDGRRPVFFTSGHYTPDALTFADRTQVPLLVYDAQAGTLKAANALGSRVLQIGLAGD